MWTWTGKQLLAGAAAVGSASLLLLALAMPSSGGESRARDLPAVEAQSVVTEAPEKGATGDQIVCAGGQTLRTSLAQKGEDFVLVATFQDVGAGRLIVEGPVGETEVSLARSPEVEGEYYGGEAMIISGKVADDGGLEATGVEPACPQFLVQEIETEEPQAPAPAPGTAAPTPDDEPNQAPGPADADDDGGPIFVMLRDDDDEDDDKDKKNEGRGNRGGGRGDDDRRGDDDERDDDDDDDDDD
jgi:hypothetical protein